MTRKVRVVEAKEWTVLPPRPGLCVECARDHNPKEPHDRDSIHYQVKFKVEHDRFPTWRDAIAHCEPSIRKIWETELRARGADLDG